MSNNADLIRRLYEKAKEEQAERGWHRWFAWRPVKIYEPILGQQTSLEPFPPGHRGKVVWWQWIERRSHGNYWEYRRC